jgi:cytochrome o ubiquinol oxidase subunit 2
MPGMSTQLNLLASSDGSYRGLSANISGQGFAGMTFVAKSTSEAGFKGWIKTVRNSSNKLSLNEYNKLSNPSLNNPIAYYSSTQSNLYNNIVYKYLTPSSGANQNSGGRTQIIPNLQQLETQGMQGMSM